MTPSLRRPWLWADLGKRHRVLSWAPANPWLTETQHLAWREVRNADLAPGFDAIAWLQDEVTAAGKPDAVGMLTSRNLDHYRLETAMAGNTRATCLATVGLSNAERVGYRQAPLEFGTINIAVQLSQGLSLPAMLEAMTIIAEARTAAVMDHGRDLPEGRATGTGTDCIALAVPLEGDAPFAGLHTDIGEAIGHATYTATAAGTIDWMETQHG